MEIPDMMIQHGNLVGSRSLQYWIRIKKKKKDVQEKNIFGNLPLKQLSYAAISDNKN
jgi:hypothetical protein